MTKEQNREVELHATSADETERIARLIGGRLKGGEIVELVSDLGGGKTTFTRGLVQGAGSKDVVASPTFTISKVYSAPTFEIHHFDFYRLGDAGLVAYELEDLLQDSNRVVVVEWGGVVGHVLPTDRVTIEISRTGEEERMLLIKYPLNLSYLVENI